VFNVETHLYSIVWAFYHAGKIRKDYRGIFHLPRRQHKKYRNMNLLRVIVDDFLIRIVVYSPTEHKKMQKKTILLHFSISHIQNLWHVFFFLFFLAHGKAPICWNSLLICEQCLLINERKQKLDTRYSSVDKYILTCCIQVWLISRHASLFFPQ
jgi:hypothetical protein